MSNIQFKRGLKANLPTLKDGEPALTIDTEDLYVGDSGTNILIGGKTITDELAYNRFLHETVLYTSLDNTTSHQAVSFANGDHITWGYSLELGTNLVLNANKYEFTFPYVGLYEVQFWGNFQPSGTGTSNFGLFSPVINGTYGDSQYFYIESANSFLVNFPMIFEITQDNSIVSFNFQLPTSVPELKTQEINNAIQVHIKFVKEGGF